MKLIRSLAAILAVSVMLGDVAYAADTGCTPISSVPFVITSPGAYCVTGYLATSQTTGSAIEIQADNVVLDFTWGGLDGLAGGIDTQAIGVFALDRNNITIQNGTIRGFASGIALENTAPDFANTSGHQVSQMLLDSNRSVGMEIRGAGTTVTKNLVESTGGTPFGSIVAILVYGPNAYLWENNIVDTAAQLPDAQATDIMMFGSGNCRVDENRIVNTASAQNLSIGILVWESPNCTVSNNDIDNRTATPLDVGVYNIDSKRVQTISNKMTNVVRNYLH